MLSVHYRLLTMTHQSKTENRDWYVMPYLEYCNYLNLYFVFVSVDPPVCMRQRVKITLLSGMRITNL